jgi:hypothetical protein
MVFETGRSARIDDYVDASGRLGVAMRGARTTIGSRWTDANADPSGAASGEWRASGALVGPTGGSEFLASL